MKRLTDEDLQKSWSPRRLDFTVKIGKDKHLSDLPKLEYETFGQIRKEDVLASGIV